MPHEITIAGRKVSLAWDIETTKRFAYRMGEVGGEPTTKQLNNPRTVTTALFKVLWGLLPPAEFQRHPDPEALFVAVDHETEAEAIFEALRAIYAERFVTAEKKSTSTTSPSPGSSSD
jgi:hypothetical protein